MRGLPPVTRTVRRAAVFTVVAALLAGSGERAFGQYQEVIVTGVDVRISPPPGRTNRDAVNQLITHNVGDALDRHRADSDLDNILVTLGVYRTERSLSYWTTEKADETGNHVLLVYCLTENPEVTDVRIEGNTVVPADAILKAVERYVAVGQVYNEARSAALGEAIGAAYTEFGYIAIADRVSFDYTTGVLTIPVVELFVSDIEIRGLTDTKENTVRRELKTEVGELWNWDTIQRDVDRLRNLDIFESVYAKPVLGREIGDVVAIFEVVEKKTGVLNVGVGYSNREGIVGFGEYSERNLGGRGRRLSGRVEFGSVHVYNITYFEPWLANDHTSMEVSLYDMTVRQNRTAFAGTQTFDQRLATESRTGGYLSLSRPLNFDETQWVSARYRYERIINEDPRLVNIISPALRRGRVGSLMVRWSNDTRDYIYDPRRGGRLDLSIEQAGGLLGGQHTFTRFDVDATRFIAVGDEGVVALRGLYGHVAGNVPIFETYAVGGAESLRGYREDRFFGTNRFLFQVELRKYLGGGEDKSDVQLVAFADVGDAFGGQWRASDGTIYRSEHRGLTPKLGYGLGVRVTTGLGPIRLDFAFSDEGPRTHFGLYQTF